MLKQVNFKLKKGEYTRLQKTAYIFFSNTTTVQVNSDLKFESISRSIKNSFKEGRSQSFFC